ncbi:MAG: hypothetical protein ACXVAX_13420 [Pseudobdellovibrio sp.]
MKWTRYSFFYVISYLLGSGTALLLFPELALKLFLSNVNYEEAIVRMSGMFILGLAVLVTQIVRYRLTQMYPAIIGVRVFFCAVYLTLYKTSGNPFFLFVFGVVAFGVLLSLAAHRLDKTNRA